MLVDVASRQRAVADHSTYAFHRSSLIPLSSLLFSFPLLSSRLLSSLLYASLLFLSPLLSSLLDFFLSSSRVVASHHCLPFLCIFLFGGFLDLVAYGIMCFPACL
ncbi:unnamed protein product [Polarella glacialis]|uniref:Transmembrane protein n=1 Tax=Polarella glacialis TaxID=89957 RepID=A0A813GYU1_POLGL|nr:unnamed protein product [Polarella glacialis]